MGIHGVRKLWPFFQADKVSSALQEYVYFLSLVQQRGPSNVPYP
jgi:hypothetical protein